VDYFTVHFFVLSIYINTKVIESQEQNLHPIHIQTNLNI